MDVLEKKRARKKEKKLAKLQSLKEQGIEINKKSKDKENVSNNSDDKSMEKPQKPVKKQKSLLTAFEVKASMQGSDKNNTKKKSNKKDTNKENEKEHSFRIDTMTREEIIQNVSANLDLQKEMAIFGKKRRAEEAVQAEARSKKKKSDKPSEHATVAPKLPFDYMSDTDPPRILKATTKFTSKFVEEPTTPLADRLKRNRGFVEEPATPKPIGFKVQSMMPEGQEFVKKANKKRKRKEVQIPEVSRAPPRPIWTSSGVFEEADVSFKTDEYISLKQPNQGMTQFKIGILGESNNIQNKKHGTGLSEFKMQALYNQKSGLRESSVDITRKMKKKELRKK